ncbi:hypothetical protein RA210_U140019 [Rubrivivax sp. A210]|uniref:hypothetical protein n=1 Tax=Rubrivivax sp. A210 TaxID=2772301 RepID=UPI00191A7231|nr:hypothetical protein [Rubrivivax sp. A210]CAD5371001.1 hypothetical protein RA210_U140019 [Rubrivivax sp. A210]
MDESNLYLVRVWSAGPRFRATARRVDDDATQLFAAPDELLHFLSKPATQAELPAPQGQPQSNGTTGGTPCASI